MHKPSRLYSFMYWLFAIKDIVAVIVAVVGLGGGGGEDPHQYFLKPLNNSKKKLCDKAVTIIFQA